MTRILAILASVGPVIRIFVRARVARFNGGRLRAVEEWTRTVPRLESWSMLDEAILFESSQAGRRATGSAR